MTRNRRGEAAKSISTGAASESWVNQSILKRLVDYDRPLLFWALAIVLATALLYGRAVGFNFNNYDDDTILTKNDVVKQFSLVPVFTQEVAHDYIPITLISYAIENAVVGLKPWIYHLDNILLHILNTLLILFISVRLTKSRVFGVFTAFLFAVHPLHVESVAWVTQRKDVLSSFFYLLALWFYLNFQDESRVESGEARRTKRDFTFTKNYLWVFGFFVLSCLSKSMAVSLPIVMILLDYLAGRKITRKVIFEKIPFFVVALAIATLHLYLHDTADLNEIPVVMQMGPVGRGLQAMAFYLEKAVFPFNLAAFYSLRVKLLEWWDYALAGVVLSLAIYLAKGSRLRMFGLFFFLVTIGPALQIVPFGNFLAFGDHYMYLPIWGLSLIFVDAALSFASRSGHGSHETHGINEADGIPGQSSDTPGGPQFCQDGKIARQPEGCTPRGRAPPALGVSRAKSAVTLLVVLVYGVLAWARVDVWQSSETLWKDVISKYPMTRDAHFDLAGAYWFEQGRAQEAINEYLITANIDPHFAYAHFNMALIYHKQGRDDLAVGLFKKALEIFPDIPEAHFNLAMIYRHQRRLREALDEVKAGLKLAPDHVKGRQLEKEIEAELP